MNARHSKVKYQIELGDWKPTVVHLKELQKTQKMRGRVRTRQDFLRGTRKNCPK